ncbi:MAG: FkbM family methyltransferase [Acidobacteriota bacterium]
MGPHLIDVSAILRVASTAARKLERVLHSELGLADKFLYVLDEVLDRVGMGRGGPRRYRLGTGETIALRPATTDRRVFDEVFLEQVYGSFVALLPTGAGPLMLVDLGANIGLSTIYLANKLCLESVVAVEPDADNYRMLQQNLAGNVQPETHLLEAFVGAERGFAEILDAGYGAWGLRIGAAAASGIPVLPLIDVISDPRGGSARGGVILKCDIEGGERNIFPGIRDWDTHVRFIILELHTEYFAVPRLIEALETSHYEWSIHGQVAAGAVLAVLGLERGVRKPETVQSGRDSRNHSSRAAAV